MNGVLAASEKRLDLFGGVIIEFVTALGGGTLRGPFLNAEIGWINHTEFIYVVIGGTAFALLFKNHHPFRSTVSINPNSTQI